MMSRPSKIMDPLVTPSSEVDWSTRVGVGATGSYEKQIVILLNMFASRI